MKDHKGYEQRPFDWQDRAWLLVLILLILTYIFLEQL